MRKRAIRQAGFTMLEILLVLVILMMIMGAVVAFVAPRFSEGQTGTTRLQLGRIDEAIQTYRLHIGRPPTEDEGLRALVRQPQFENETLASRWRGPYLDPDFDFTDPWGNTLRYEPVDAAGTDDDRTGGRGYRLFSMGPDGQPDTDDDIYARERRNETDDI